MSMTAGALDPNATVVAIPPNLLPMFQEAAQRYGVPLNVLAIVAQAESGFNPVNVGDNGTSYGLFQIHLPAHPDVTAAQASDPHFNINWAAQSLGAAYRRYNGNVVATILYNNCPVCADHFASTGTYGPTQALSAASQRYLGQVLKPVGGVVGVGTTGTEWLGGSTGSSVTNPTMPLQSLQTGGDPVLQGFQAMLAGTQAAGTTATQSSDIVAGGDLTNALGVSTTAPPSTDSTNTSAASPDTTTIPTTQPVSVAPTGGRPDTTDRAGGAQSGI